jgi:hypothetical protein
MSVVMSCWFKVVWLERTFSLLRLICIVKLGINVHVHLGKYLTSGIEKAGEGSERQYNGDR